MLWNIFVQGPFKLSNHLEQHSFKTFKFSAGILKHVISIKNVTLLLRAPINTIKLR